MHFPAFAPSRPLSFSTHPNPMRPLSPARLLRSPLRSDTPCPRASALPSQPSSAAAASAPTSVPVPDPSTAPVLKANPLLLSDLREILIRQEETIIFALIERAQFALNQPIYTPGYFNLPPYPPHPSSPAVSDSDSLSCDGSFSQYMLYELEKLHARMGRYNSPDENPFAPAHLLPSSMLPPASYKRTLVSNDINVNHLLERIYRHSVLPEICSGADDGDYGSSATCDAACLQALSKRIHYGKYIAEAKCQADEPAYAAMAAANDRDGIWAALSDFDVEKRLLKRVENKARNYGSDISFDRVSDVFKVPPPLIARLYLEFIIPLTKDVEVDYILHRYSLL